tara:strand:+ start:496 stop:642 length:147 start_codon:yes stop_codon:yes gene_type:complete
MTTTLYKQGKKNIVPLDVWLERIFSQHRRWEILKKKSEVKRGAEKNVK